MSSNESKRSKKRKNKKSKSNVSTTPSPNPAQNLPDEVEDAAKSVHAVEPKTGSSHEATRKDLEVIERLMDGDEDQESVVPGMTNGSNPYLVGERCLLCMCERPGTPQSSTEDDDNSSTLGIVSQRPLWVCSDCRKTVEEDERRANAESALLDQDMKLKLEPPPFPMLPNDLTMPSSEPTTPDGNLCTCQACTERRQIQAEHEKETQLLQQCWNDLRHAVRYIYRNAGTKESEDNSDLLSKVSLEKMKELVHRLCTRDPHQLFQRLESQGREFVTETKVKVFQQLTSGHKTPPQAKAFVSLMLEEYTSLCSAAKILASFLTELEEDHLEHFNLTWERHNKHLFQSIVYSDPLVQNSLPMLMRHLRLGAGSKESYHEDTYPTLLQWYLNFDNEMSVISVEWRDCQQLIDKYNDDQATLKARQKMLKDDWEFFKAQKLLEQQVLKNTKVSCNTASTTPSLEAKFTETMRHLLQGTKPSTEDCHCPNCNRKRCPCDECTISHMITCGILTPEMTETMSLPHQPAFTHDPSRYMIDVKPPSMSSTSSSSGSSSPSPSPIDRKSLALPFEDSIDNFDNEDNEFLEELEDSDDESFPSHLLNKPSLLDSDKNGDSLSSSLNEEMVQPATKCDCSHCSAQEQVEQLKVLENTCQCHACLQQTGKAVPTSLPQHIPTMPRPAALHLYPHIHGSNTLHSLHANHVGHVRPLLHPHLYDLHVPMKQTKPVLQTQKKHSGSFDVDSPELILQEHIQHVYTHGEWDSSYDNSKLLLGSKYNGSLGSELFTAPPPLVNSSSFMADTHMSMCEALPKTNVKMSCSIPVSSHASCVTKTTSITSSSVDQSVPECFKNLAPINRTLLNQAKVTCQPVTSGAGATEPSSTSFSDLCSKHNPFFHVHQSMYSGASSNQTTMTTPSPSAVQQAQNEFKLKFINAAKEEMSKTLGNIAHNANLPRSCSHPLGNYNNLNQLSNRMYPTTGVLDPNTGTCASSVAMPASINNVSVGTASVCTDQDCDAHTEETYDSIDDSCSEQSNSTSNSNQKDSKYCDCCYCELLGHGSPTGIPANRNSSEIRERLRLRLKRKNETKHESPSGENCTMHHHSPSTTMHNHLPVTCTATSSHTTSHEPIGTKGLDELIKFINGTDDPDGRNAKSAKAAKRARQKQRKLEERRKKEETRKKENVQPNQSLPDSCTTNLPEAMASPNRQECQHSQDMCSPNPSAKTNHHSFVTPMDVGAGPQTENVQKKQSISKNCVMVTSRPERADRAGSCDSRNSPEPAQCQSKKMKKKNNVNGLITAMSLQDAALQMETMVSNGSAECLSRKSGSEQNCVPDLPHKPAGLNLPETWSQDASACKKKKGKNKKVSEKLSNMSSALESTFTGYLKEMITNNMHVMENISPNHHHENGRGDHTNETVILHRPQLHDPKSTRVMEDLHNAKNQIETNHRHQRDNQSPGQEKSREEQGQNSAKRKNKKDTPSEDSPTHHVQQKAARNESVDSKKKPSTPVTARSVLTNQTNHTITPKSEGDNLAKPSDSPSSPARAGKAKAQNEQGADRRAKNKKKKNKSQDDNSFIDDVFLPKRDTDKGDMDEIERELEEFKRFCLDCTPSKQREKIPVSVNLKDIFSKKKSGLGCS